MGDTIAVHPVVVNQMGPMLAENRHVGRDAQHIRLQRRIPRCSRNCPWREPLPQIGGFH